MTQIILAAHEHLARILVFCASWVRVSPEKCITYATALLLATCLFNFFYRALFRGSTADNPTPSPNPDVQIPPSLSVPAPAPTKFKKRSKQTCPSVAVDHTGNKPPRPPRSMRYSRYSRPLRKPQHFSLIPALSPPTVRAKQPYDALLVLDVEATCYEGTDFNFPNEIIEFPVCLMRWKDRAEDGCASQLEVVEEFRSFVRPSWRPLLSQFCTSLTGITQEQVNAAPSFPQVLNSFEKFLFKHGLINEDGDRLVRFCWCSDGPFDIRDFVVKQCFISKIQMPGWIQGDVIDVRTSVMDWLHAQEATNYATDIHLWTGPRRRTLNIPAQLKVLGMTGFEGRQHCGIDDTRNIARIIAELARRGLSLYPNTAVHPNRRWQWMGKRGQILEYWLPPILAMDHLPPPTTVLPPPILAN